MADDYDLVVLGGGIGGYVAAIRAAQFGQRTAIVEKEKLGGTCLHKGCIPSKALLRSAEVLQTVKQSNAFGIVADNVRFDFAMMRERKDRIVSTLYHGVQQLMKKHRIDVYNGYGTILGPSIFSPSAGTISVSGENGDNNRLTSKHVLVATGSSVATIPGIDMDGTYILSSDEAVALTEIPKSILIIGGGIIGVEWASLLIDLGVDVTIIEMDTHLLPNEDEAVSSEVERQLANRGVQIRTNTTIDPSTVQIKQDSVQARVIKEGSTTDLQAQKMLVAVGRKPNVSHIGLENTKIEVENGQIIVNEYYQTKEEHIYAAGDVTGGPQLAHVAAAEAAVAIEHMFGKQPLPLQSNRIPFCVYSHPQVARIGLTEKAARARGYDVRCAQIPFSAIGKSHVNGQTDGFVKMIKDQKTEDLLGVHIIGPQATELISEAGIAMLLDATPWEVTNTIHPHPSLSESIGEAALAVEGVHIHT